MTFVFQVYKSLRQKEKVDKLSKPWTKMKLNREMSIIEEMQISSQTISMLHIF